LIVEELYQFIPILPKLTQHMRIQKSFPSPNPNQANLIK